MEKNRVDYPVDRTIETVLFGMREDEVRRMLHLILLRLGGQSELDE